MNQVINAASFQFRTGPNYFQMNHITKLAMFLLIAGIYLAMPVQDSVCQEEPKTANSVVQRYIKAIGGTKALKQKRNLKISFFTTSTAKRAVPEYKSNLFISGLNSVYEEGENNRTWYAASKKQPWNRFGPVDRKLPVHHQHPSALPLFILNYPAPLEWDQSQSSKSKYEVLVAQSIFPPKQGMRDPSPKAFLFNKKTGLLERIEYGERAVDFKDYRKLDSLMIPRTVVYDFFGRDSVVEGKYVSKITEILSDYKMDSSLFELPEVPKRRGK